MATSYSIKWINQNLPNHFLLLDIFGGFQMSALLKQQVNIFVFNIFFYLWVISLEMISWSTIISL